MDKHVSSSGRTIKLSVPVAFVLLSGPENKIIFASQSMAEWLGTTPGDIINQSAIDLFPKHIKRNINNILKTVYKHKRAYQAPENPVNTFQEGRLQPGCYNFSFEPYLDGVGNILGIFAVITDVAGNILARQREQQLETELHALYSHLEAEQKEKK